MKSLLIAHFLLLLVALAPAQTITDLQKSFWDRLVTIEIEQEDKLDSLNNGYKTALQRLIDDYQKSGKLEEILIVRKEIAKTQKDNVTESKDSELKEPKELLPLRKKYLETRKKILEKNAADVVTLVDRAKSLLEEQIVTLTKSGKIDEAIKAKAALEKIASDKFILAATNLNDTNIPAASGWTSLTTAKMDIVKNGFSSLGWLSEPENHKKNETSEWGKVILAQSVKQPTLLSYPNCTVRFKLRNTITQFRTKLSLAHANGNVTFIVLVDGREIKKEALSGAVGTKPFDCTFPKTKEIELQVNNNGAMDYDWAAWINPEVR